MLNSEQQDEIIKAARKLSSRLQSWRTRAERGTISQQSLRDAVKAEEESFRDVLKEL